MAKKKANNQSDILSDLIIRGIQEKKGHEIVSLNFKKFKSSVCDYFIICHGNSKPQLEAIASSIEEVVHKKLKVWPWRREGFQNAEWILLDYVDVVVHIFIEDKRKYYQLENLWADAKTVRVDV